MLVLVAAASAWGQQTLVEEGYDHFYNLEYDQASPISKRPSRRIPDVPDLHNHLAQAIVFQEMYRNGALESELVSGNNSFLRRPKTEPRAGHRKALPGRSGQGHGTWPTHG